MDNKIDRELLQQLHDEINKTQTVDDKGKELLRDLDGDIRELLERSEEHPGTGAFLHHSNPGKHSQPF